MCEVQASPCLVPLHTILEYELKDTQFFPVNNLITDLFEPCLVQRKHNVIPAHVGQIDIRTGSGFGTVVQQFQRLQEDLDSTTKVGRE